MVDVDLEKALFSWTVELRSRNLCVPFRKMIQQLGRSLSFAKDFHASTSILDDTLSEYAPV